MTTLTGPIPGPSRVHFQDSGTKKIKDLFHDQNQNSRLFPGFPGPLATLEVLRCFQLYANLGSKFKSNLKYILNIYHVMKSVWSVLITQSQVTRASAAYVASIFINSSFMFTLTSSEIWGQQYCKNFEIQKFLQVFLTNFYVI